MTLASPAAASAHAMLVSADPAAGSTTSLLSVELKFSEALETRFSSIGVFDSDGGAITGETRFGSKMMTFTFEYPPPPAEYEVRWRVLSVDGHVTQGAYQFTLTPVR
jgi:methionine-rich copper-binding protein CopC